MNASNPTTSNRRRNWLIASGIAVLVIACLVLFGLANLFGFGPSRTLVLVPINPTESFSTANEVPVTATEVAVVTEIAPVCDTPSILAGIDTADSNMGEYLDTILGERMTYTSRRLLVPEKAWNVELTPTELAIVEETWQEISVCIPEGFFGRIFAGGFEQGVSQYNNGVILTLQPGTYQFQLRNGEIVIWYPNQDSFADADLERIFTQVRDGNFDIHAELEFFATTADILPLVPTDMVQEKNIQIVPAPAPQQ